jgi:hypothetical protein
MRSNWYPLEPIPNSRNPVDYPSNDQELQTVIVKRTMMDPRQIRRLAKSAKQRLGIRLQ